MPTFYHATHVNNYTRIIEKGLLPKILIPEKKAREPDIYFVTDPCYVYLSQNPATPLPTDVVLEVKLDENFPLQRDAEYFLRYTPHIGIHLFQTKKWQERYRAILQNPGVANYPDYLVQRELSPQSQEAAVGHFTFSTERPSVGDVLAGIDGISEQCWNDTVGSYRTPVPIPSQNISLYDAGDGTRNISEELDLAIFRLALNSEANRNHDSERGNRLPRGIPTLPRKK